MKICIKRGSREIGGSCVELTACNGKRLLVDFGLPLDAPEASPELMPDIRGPLPCGLLVSHAHADHYALAQWLDARVPVYIGKVARKLIEAANLYSPQKCELKNTQDISPWRPFTVADTFRVTPYWMDHSAYDAYAFLIEADGRRVFYTGDFRAHGRINVCVERLIASPPKRVNVLLMEGSMLGRGDEKSQTEEALESRFENVFRGTRGVAAVMASSTNLNRLVTLYKAAVRAGRELVVPPHVGLLTLVTGNKNLPNFKHFKHFKKWDERSTQRHAVSSAAVLAEPGRYVVLLKTSITETLLANGLFCPGASFIYSMWGGYKKQERMATTLAQIERAGTRMEDLHTSGHADIPTLKRFAEAMNADRIVPIHTQQPERYFELFGPTVERRADGEEFLV
jgi:ribonuclease J